jgi:hypothetical protein
MEQHAKAALKEIEKLLDTLLQWPEEDRISLYKQIDPHLLKLESMLAQSPNKFAAEKLSQLKFHLIMAARLYERDEHTDEQHCAWAKETLQLLRSHQCFAAGAQVE